MLVDLMSSNWATFCMTTLVQTIPSCEIVIVLCVALKSRICIRTSIKVGESMRSKHYDNSPVYPKELTLDVKFGPKEVSWGPL